MSEDKFTGKALRWPPDAKDSAVTRVVTGYDPNTTTVSISGSFPAEKLRWYWRVIYWMRDRFKE